MNMADEKPIKLNGHNGILNRWMKLERKMRTNTDNCMAIRESIKSFDHDKHNAKINLYSSIQKMNDIKKHLDEYKELVIDTFKLLSQE